MDPELFDELKTSLERDGADAAIERLCAALRERKDYTGLFYALLMKRRHELGVSPIPTGPSQDLPKEVHEPYEEAIRQAGRTSGKLYLDEGNIPAAWAFFRMLGEPELVRDALEKFKPLETEDVHPMVDVAFHQGVNVRKGFDLIVQRFGICSAITTLSGGDHQHSKEDRDWCIQRLVRALYDELRERLIAEIEHQQGFKPTGKTIPELIAGRDWLFQDDVYHIDIS